VIIIKNSHSGKGIRESNYWGSDFDEAGKLLFSPSGGHIRVLVPEKMSKTLIDKVLPANHAVMSRCNNQIEILWEDFSINPFAMMVTDSSFVTLPGLPPEGKTWVITMWIRVAPDDINHPPNTPHCAVNRVCYLRSVPSIPWLKPWDPTTNIIQEGV